MCFVRRMVPVWKFSKLCEKNSIMFLYYATNCTQLSLFSIFWRLCGHPVHIQVQCHWFMNGWKGLEANQGRAGSQSETCGRDLVRNCWGHDNHSFTPPDCEVPPTSQMVNMLRVLSRTIHLLLAAVFTRSGGQEGSVCPGHSFFHSLVASAASLWTTVITS